MVQRRLRDPCARGVIRIKWGMRFRNLLQPNSAFNIMQTRTSLFPDSILQLRKVCKSNLECHIWRLGRDAEDWEFDYQGQIRGV